MSGYYGSETSVGGFAKHSIYDIRIDQKLGQEANSALLVNDKQEYVYNRDLCEAISLYAGIDTNDKVCCIEDGPSSIAKELAQFCSLSQPITSFFVSETELLLEEFIFSITSRNYPIFDKILLRTCLYNSQANRNIFKHLNTMLQPVSGKLIILHRCSLCLSLPFPNNVREKLLGQEYSSTTLLTDALASDFNVEWDILKLVQIMPARMWMNLLNHRRIQPIKSVPLTAETLRYGIVKLTESCLKYTPSDSIDDKMQLVDTLLLTVLTPLHETDSKATFLQRFKVSYNVPRLVHEKKRKMENNYELDVTSDLQRVVFNEMPHIWNKSRNMFSHIVKEANQKDKYKREWWGTVASLEQLGRIDSAKIPSKRLNDYYLRQKKSS